MTERKLEITAAPTAPTVMTRRVVCAPRNLVFETHTVPEYLKQWVGPKWLPMVRCESDLRVNGHYRFVHREPGGMEFTFHGVYLDVVRPERLVRTFVFEPMAEHEVEETLILEELGGQTIINTTSLHKTFEGRDGQLFGGRMEAVMMDCYARLDALLAALQFGSAR